MSCSSEMKQSHVLPLTHIHSCRIVVLTHIVQMSDQSHITRNKGRPLLFPDQTSQSSQSAHTHLTSPFFFFFFFDSNQLKQKLYTSQQRAMLCSRTAEQADESREEAERSRALAEARALGSQRDKETAEADRGRLSEELQQLKKEVNMSSCMCRVGATS